MRWSDADCFQPFGIRNMNCTSPAVVVRYRDGNLYGEALLTSAAMLATKAYWGFGVQG